MFSPVCLLVEVLDKHPDVFAAVENALHLNGSGTYLVFKPVSNSLTLSCDHFDLGL